MKNTWIAAFAAMTQQDSHYAGQMIAIPLVIPVALIMSVKMVQRYTGAGQFPTRMSCAMKLTSFDVFTQRPET